MNDGFYFVGDFLVGYMIGKLLVSLPPITAFGYTLTWVSSLDERSSGGQPSDFATGEHEMVA